MNAIQLFIAFILSCGLVMPSAAQTQAWQWANHAGSPAPDYKNTPPNPLEYEYAAGIVVDKLGNSYICGKVLDVDHFFDTINPPVYGYFDAFVAKLDCEGNFVWVRTFGGNKLDEAIGIELIGDYLYFAINYYSNNQTIHIGQDSSFFTKGIQFGIYKYDLEGNEVWLQHSRPSPNNALGNGGANIGSFTIDEQDNLLLYLKGGTNAYFSSTDSFPSYPNYPYANIELLVKMDTNANINSKIDITQLVTDQAEFIGQVASIDDKIVLYGYTNGPKHFLHYTDTLYHIGQLYMNTFAFYCVFEPNGTLLSVNHFESYSTFNGQPYYASRINNVDKNFMVIAYAGNLTYPANLATTTDSAGANSLLEFNNWNVTKRFHYTNSVGYRFYVYSNNSEQYFYGQFANYFILPDTTYFSTGFTDACVVKLNSDYEIDTMLVITGDLTGPATGDIVYGLATDPEGNLYVAGQMEATLKLGDDSLVRYGGESDIFVAKFGLPTCPEPESVEEFQLASNKGGLVLYPNPNSGKFTIVAPEALLQVEIYALDGRKVTQTNGELQHQLDVYLLQPGLYVVKGISAAGHQYASKVVVE